MPHLKMFFWCHLSIEGGIYIPSSMHLSLFEINIRKFYLIFNYVIFNVIIENLEKYF